MKYLIPGKTFLLGEYSALVGGSVLGLATGPGFLVEYDRSFSETKPFHDSSPAGFLWNQMSNMFLPDDQDVNQTVNFKFTDLFKAGGFGKSTAEYLSVLIPSLNNINSFEKIRYEYQNNSLQSGAKVSGLDLAIQYFGETTFFNAKTNSYSSSGWMLKDYDFILVSTGNKIKTHEHIQELDLKRIEHFPKISNPIIDLYFDNKPLEFIRGLNEWSNFLREERLADEKSFELVQRLKMNSDILCAKPCGAMGADVILIICEKEKSPSVQHKISHLGLQIKATSKDLVIGIKAQLNNSTLNIGAAHVD